MLTCVAHRTSDRVWVLVDVLSPNISLSLTTNTVHIPSLSSLEHSFYLSNSCILPGNSGCCTSFRVEIERLPEVVDRARAEPRAEAKIEGRLRLCAGEYGQSC